MRVLKNIFEAEVLNASVYKSSLDGVATLVVSFPGVEGVKARMVLLMVRLYQQSDFLTVLFF